MKTIKVRVYQYDELNEDAKEKARSWLLEDGFLQQWEFDSVMEDAKNVDLVIEEMESDGRRNAKGHFQNDGQGTAYKIMENHGNTCDTWKDAENFLWDVAIVWRDEFDEDADELTYQGEKHIEKLEEEFLETLLNDYQSMARKTVEYAESEEYVKDSMAANEYTFTKDGKRFG